MTCDLLEVVSTSGLLTPASVNRISKRWSSFLAGSRVIDTRILRWPSAVVDELRDWLLRSQQGSKPTSAPREMSQD